LKLPRFFAITFIILGTSIFSLPTANAESTGQITVVCANDAGESRNFGVGWNNTNQFFEGKGNIAALFCQIASGGWTTFISTTAPESTWYYNGVAPAPEPTPEPEPTPSPTPSPSVEPTPEPVQPQPEPSPSPSETSTATVTPEPVVPVPSPEPTNTVPLPEPLPTPVPAPEPAPEPVPEPLPIQPAPVPEPPVVIPTPEPVLEPEIQPEITPEPVPVEETPVPEPEPEDVPIEEEQPEPAPEPEPEEEVLVPVTPELEPELAPEPPIEEPEPPVVATENSTPEEREIIAEALIEAANGEPLTADAIEEAGLAYEDLPPDTPVEVRKDEDGNEIVITAEVAAALVVLENPAALVSAIFTDPAKALLALGSIGADMSVEERQESEKTIVAAVIVGGIATQSALTAAASVGTIAYRRNH